MKVSPSAKELKTFLLIFSGIFLAISLYPLTQGTSIHSWALLLSLLILALALLQPQYAKGFYLVWVKVGETIGNIISKIIMVILFFGVFTPVAMILKLLKKDLLRKKIEPVAILTGYLVKQNQAQ